MVKALCVFVLAVLATRASQAGECSSGAAASAAQPAAAAHAQRTQPNRIFSYQPSQGAYSYSAPYYYGSRYSWGVRPAASKALGNYAPHRGF